MGTLQDIVDLAVQKCGGSQSELARELKRRFDVEASPQLIEYLQQRTRKKAQRSSLTAYIAQIAGLKSTAVPKPQLKGARKPEPIEAALIVAVKIKETGKVEKVELTSEVLRAAKALMKMDSYDREEVLAKVEALEIKNRALRGKGAVPDDELRHLARTDTPEGRALATKGKKRVSRHSS